MQCDGGKPSTGHNCFTARLMWRAGGAGEGKFGIPWVSESMRWAHEIIVYAYILDSNDLCERDDITCSKGDFGTSMNRGSFTLKSGEFVPSFTRFPHDSTHAGDPRSDGKGSLCSCG